MCYGNFQMKTNFADEFARLQIEFAEETGRQRIEDAWQIALNYEKKDGQWFKKRASAGDRVSGFAIDLETKKYEIGAQGRDHDLPRLDLIRRLRAEGDTESFDEGECRVIKGWIAQIEDWSFPFLFLSGFWDVKTYPELERFVFEKQLGMPLRGLFQKYRGF